MSITMGELLAANIIPDLEILTVPENFADTVITLTSSLTIYDMPISGFLQPGELIFASAVGVPDEEASQIAFFDELHACHASGLIISFKNQGYRLPQPIIDHAAAKGLPVFALPWQQRFFDIQFKITNMILHSRERAFRNLQTALFDLFHDMRPLDDAAQAIAMQLLSHVRIVDLDGAILGKSSDAALAMEHVQKVVIDLNGMPAAYLILCPQRGDDPFDADILARCVCSPLSLWFFRKSIETQTVERLKNDFVWKLANELYSSFDEMLYQSRQLRLDLGKSYTCLALEMQQGKSELSKGSYISAFNARQTFVQKLLEKIAAQMHLQLMFSSYASQIIIYLEYRKAADHSPERFIDLVHAELSERFPERKIFWGISESAEGPVDFAALYKHALQALSYSLRSLNRHYRFTYHDTKEAQITNLLMQNAALREEAAAVIEKLTGYSDPSGIDLFGTLRMYMHCNYNISQTARSLFIHRQSLLYRLGKIEELTGMSLHDHRHLFLLEIYAHIYVGY